MTQQVELIPNTVLGNGSVNLDQSATIQKGFFRAGVQALDNCELDDRGREHFGGGCDVAHWFRLALVLLTAAENF